MQAAKQGLRVCVVEKFGVVGGSCTHLGTIPSKALRHAAYHLVTLCSDSASMTQLDSKKSTFADLLKRARMVIRQQVELRSNHYGRNDISVVFGTGRLMSANEVEVAYEDGQTEVIQAKHIVLATGSRPFRPQGIDFDHHRVFDSDTILKLAHRPRVITIYGAGVIGCEYTSIFRSLGRKVNLINTREQLLSFLDDEIIDALSYHLRDQGVLIKHGEVMESMETTEDEIVLTLQSGKRIRSDVILFATGRRGNSDHLGLEDLGIAMDRRGQVEVNGNYQTACDNIYAVGDLVGFPSLASAAYDQGRFAARQIADASCDDSLVKDIPVGIYTIPEISCIGKTEAELTDACIPYEVGHAAFRHLARAQITGQTVGMLKILFHCETLEILGIHCFGQNAAEIIHIGQAVMAQKAGGNSIKYFVDTTFNYPTMAEAYRVAALNGLNRLCTR